MNRQLEQKRTSTLLLELVYNVMAEQSAIPEIAATAQVDVILRILESRCGRHFDGRAEMCFEWFLGDSSPLTAGDKAKIVRLQDARDGKRDFTATFEEILNEMKKNES